MNFLKVTGKFLDQPILVAKFNKAFPVILAVGATAYCAHNVKNAAPEDKKNIALKDGITMATTVASALIAPRFVNKLFKNPLKTLSSIKESNKKIVDEFLSVSKVDAKSNDILQKAKEKVLNFKEVNYVYENLGKNEQGKGLLDKLIPNPENITSKDIFSEIGRLSLLGFIPVVGGVVGGVIGDKLTTTDWKARIPNKIKEGVYQYLANIFLCNVGAGIALSIMEKLGFKSKGARALGMITGIVAMGVAGGSVIANIISNRLINPLFGQKSSNMIFNERRPEALDIGLHTDDIATVAVMSGLKWIEPALPIMYSISGYRAGIGYRNKNVNKCNKTV